MPAEPFVGQIVLVAFNFAPKGYAFCQGQIMSIAQNTALFSLLGTTYGGNGQTTFALPDLRGRAALAAGQAPGLSSYDLGQEDGVDRVTVLLSQLAGHGHLNASSADASTTSPAGGGAAVGGAYAPVALANATMPSGVSAAGGGQPHNNMQPYLTLNYVIALAGIFPSRN
jgi:microcystin-dependent protein